MAKTAERGMGRGLAALLSVAPEPEADELTQLPVAAIEPNPDQPRKEFDEEALLALAESLKARGVLQPVLVEPATEGRYRLIAGERRWRAAQLAQLDTIPAIVREAGAAALELALIENMAREDLNPVEEARACAALTEELGLTREEVGRRVGRSRVAISNLLRLLDLPDEALALIESGQLTEGHGRALLMAQNHEARRRLAGEAAEKGWSVRELENQARGGAAKPRKRKAKVELHPDLAEALVGLEENWSSALGVSAKAHPAGEGVRLELHFDTLTAARECAKQLSAE